MLLFQDDVNDSTYWSNCFLDGTIYTPIQWINGSSSDENNSSGTLLSPNFSTVDIGSSSEFAIYGLSNSHPGGSVQITTDDFDVPYITDYMFLKVSYSFICYSGVWCPMIVY